MAYQDFDTDWTEVDAPGEEVITLTDTQVLVDGLEGGASLTRVYRDMGVDYFDGDFVHGFETYLGDSNPAYTAGHFYIWGLTKVYSATEGLDEYGGYVWDLTGVRWYYSGGSWRLRLEIWEGFSIVPDDSDLSVPLSSGVMYYVVVDRDDAGGVNGTGRYTVTIRTGSHTGSVVDTLTADSSVGQQLDFRYIWAFDRMKSERQSYDNFELRNLDLEISLPWWYALNYGREVERMADEYAVSVVGATDVAVEFTTGLSTTGIRKKMFIYNLSHANSGEVYLGPSTVTPEAGFALEKSKLIELDFTDNLDTYFVAEAGEFGDLRILELSE
jgi:hypothetical protein